jgi:hypothetical protein
VQKIRRLVRDGATLLVKSPKEGAPNSLPGGNAFLNPNAISQLDIFLIWRLVRVPTGTNWQNGQVSLYAGI